jgi:hypothetical protein
MEAFPTPTSSCASVRLGEAPSDEMRSYLRASSWSWAIASGLVSPIQKGVFQGSDLQGGPST